MSNESIKAKRAAITRERDAMAAALEKIDDKELIEILADIEHERWSGWMRWMFDNWTEDNIARWKMQMVTPYSDLPEYSKESDRKEVRKTLEAIKRHLEQEHRQKHD